MNFDKIYTYHTPNEGQKNVYELIRRKARELAELIDITCPTSREKNIAFMHLESTVMWANASIARS